ncbi:hypothetical protein [Metallosphaera yellowstonensis]|uniref:hypothetical protein n=1 Tax=Metallosphaera yellowstonensis TaxID=1111107 RepID=UPI000AF27375|nr:hypothetical protein [Metallosphaera yellowstonensis]
MTFKVARKKREEEEEESSGEEAGAKKSKKEKYVDPEKLLEEYLEEVKLGLNLSYLNLDRDVFRDIIKEPFIAAVGQVKTKPKVRTIVNRLNASGDALLEYIAAKLLQTISLSKMSDEQFEFVVYHVGKLVNELAATLYAEAKRRNRPDLIDFMRSLWNQSSSLRSPVTCPKCGFRAIMPDLSCKVCGYVMQMRELKDNLHLMEQLKDMASTNPEEFKEIVSSGYLFYGSLGPSAPSRFKAESGGIYYEVILTAQEKDQLRKLYSSLQQR